MAIISVNEDDFDEEIANGVVVVDFWAEWCSPCKMILPILEELSAEMPGVKFIKVNVDENQSVSVRLGISSIPTLLIYKNNDLAEKIVGFMPGQLLKDKILKYLN